jgi:hypothetical protein
MFKKSTRGSVVDKYYPTRAVPLTFRVVYLPLHRTRFLHHCNLITFVRLNVASIGDSVAIDLILTILQ